MRATLDWRGRTGEAGGLGGAKPGPALPPDVATEVTAYFAFLSSWLTRVIQRGIEQGTLVIEHPPAVEAEIFLATVYGAMLSARAQNNPRLFDAILKPTLARLTPAVS